MKYFTLLLLALVTACASQSKSIVEAPVVEPINVELRRFDGSEASSSQVPLNVGILLFTPVDADGATVSRIYEPIRDAESAYFPILLRDTLVESGYWGAVKVVAVEDALAEVIVTATVVESNAVNMQLKVKVRDARNVVWIDKTYVDTATDFPYETANPEGVDPFQDLFNQIANDMALVQLALSEKDVSNILDTAMLQYALSLSPEAFGRYLVEDQEGQIIMAGLPARNDPMYQRVKKIRESEYAMQEVVDEHFNLFFNDMKGIYPFWRQSSYELLVYNQQISEDGSKGSRPRSGTWLAIENVYNTYKELKLNEDELRELSGSFEREIAPTITELEGRVIELEGSLQTQYKTWRKILRQIYASERGL